MARLALAVLVLVLLPGCTRLDMTDAAAVPCAQLTLSVSPPNASVHDVVNVTLLMVNCGQTTIEVPASNLCASGLRIRLEGPAGSFDVDDSHASPYDPAFWGVSQGACMIYWLPESTAKLPIRFTLAPGANHTVVHTLNGTLVRRAWCAIEGEGRGVTFCDDPVNITPGEYALSVSFTPVHGKVVGAETTANATLTIGGPTVPRASTHLLYVRERDWLNGTGNERFPADFGPHCAPAELANGTLVLRAFGETARVESDEWAMVRDFGADPHDHSTTYSADHVDYRALTPSGGWAPSPWNASVSVVQVTPLQDGRAYVNGTLLSPDEETTVRTETDIGAYHATSIAVVRLVGEVPLRVETVGLCD